ncbi:MAG TPA: endonuclease/exonuclease/phosphatase family protein, partial [Isosphaeraceae bacterium]
VAGAPLVLLVSHWTSRLTDETDAKRSAYAQAIYAAFLEHYRADPAADVLIAGDFNDEPDDPSLRDGLHVTADADRVRAGGPRPPLLDLMAGKDPDQLGTYYYNGRWQILDHIVVAPGLLDPAGWQALPETARTENPDALRTGRSRRPLRFGGPKNQNPRGPSDHFAVTIRLRVGQPEPRVSRQGAKEDTQRRKGDRKLGHFSPISTADRGPNGSLPRRGGTR